MAFTTDPTDPIGKVRLYNGDRTEAKAIFDDDETNFFISEESTLKRAAAASLEAMAASNALLAKALESMNFKEDTRNVATALLATAQRLRDSENEEPAEGFSEWAITGPVAREIVFKKALRGTG